MWVFGLTYFAYASVHAARKSFSNSKAQLHEFYGFSAEEEGRIDALFMLVYALGLVLGGRLGDRRSTRKVLSVGLIGTSICQTFLGQQCVTAGPGVYPLVVLSAAFQSVTWPAAVKLISQNYAGNRSLAFGLWVTNTAVGNILGSLLAGLSFNLKGDKEGVLGVFVLPSILCLISGLLLLGLLAERQQSVYHTLDREMGMSYLECFKTQGIPQFSIAYGLFKGVAYAMFFWLPFYFVKVRHLEAATADAFSGLFDVGQVLGAPVVGLLAHKLKRPFAVCAMAGLLSGLPLVAMNSVADSVVSIAVALISSGLLLGGAVGLIGSEVCVLLCPRATSTAVGIVDGFGSLGAAVTQSTLPWLAQRLGWNVLFPECALMVLAGGLILHRPVLRELSEGSL